MRKALKLPKGIEFRSGAYRARKRVEGTDYRATFDTLKDAELWLKKVDVERRTDKLNPKTELKLQTFGELLESYLASREGIHRYHADRVKASFLGSMNLYDINQRTLIKFRDDMLSEIKEDKKGMPILDESGKPLKRYSKATVVRRMNIVSAVISYGIAQKNLPFEKNFASSEFVSRPENADLRRTRRVSREEFKLILKNMKHPIDQKITILAYYQACRQGEIFNLEWKDLDLREDFQLLKLPQTKNMAHRKTEGPEERPLMPIPFNLFVSMKRRNKKAKPTEKVFPINQDAFKKRFYKLVRKLGLDDLHFHDLRHEATSQIALVFPNPNDLRLITGHLDLESVARYYHPDKSQMAKDARERMKILKRKTVGS